MKTAKITLTEEQQEILAPLIKKMESINDDNFIGIAQLKIPDEHNGLDEPEIEAAVLTGLEAWMITEDVNRAFEDEWEKAEKIKIT